MSEKASVLQVPSKSPFCRKNSVFVRKCGEGYEKLVVLKVSSKSRYFFLKNMVFSKMK